MPKAFGTGALVAACVWAYAEPAAACGACVCDDGPRAIINLIRDVPLNLEIPLRARSDQEPPPWVERASDGAKVPATVRRLATPAAVWWLKVDQDLEPGTDYRIVGEQGPEAGFTSGAARDETAPTLGDVSAMTGGNGDLCDASIGGHLTLNGAADGQQFSVWVELEVDVDGTALTLFTDYELGGIRLGSSPMGCFGSNEVSGFVDGGGYPVRLRLHDAAGNVGEWKSLGFTASAEQPGGCGTPISTAGTGTTDPKADGGAAAGGSTTAGNSAAGNAAASSRTSKGCALSLGTPRSGSSLATLLALGTCALLARRRSLAVVPHERTP